MVIPVMRMRWPGRTTRHEYSVHLRKSGFYTVHHAGQLRKQQSLEIGAKFPVM
jgi:hypothetical protein